MSDARVATSAQLDHFQRLAGTKELHHNGLVLIRPDELLSIIEAARLPRSGDGASGEGDLNLETTAMMRTEAQTEALRIVAIEGRSFADRALAERVLQLIRDIDRLLAMVAPPPVSDASPAEAPLSTRLNATVNLGPDHSEAQAANPTGDTVRLARPPSTQPDKAGVDANPASPSPAPMAKCQRCDGSGYLGVGAERRACDECDGTGEAPAPMAGETAEHSKEWWLNRAKAEGDMPIGAGVPDRLLDRLYIEADFQAGEHRPRLAALFKEAAAALEATPASPSPAPMAGETPRQIAERIVTNDDLCAACGRDWSGRDDCGVAKNARDYGQQIPCTRDRDLTDDIEAAIVAERDAAQKRQDEARKALEFYADPFNRKDEFGERLQVPDFYSELDFGETARQALASLQGSGA